MNVSSLAKRGSGASRIAVTIVAVVAALIVMSAGVAAADNFKGTKKDDRLVGTNKADRINGLGGNDSIFGKPGNDTLIGREGNDLLVGNEGNDEMMGGTGRDELQAGNGDDELDAGNDNQTDKLFCGGGDDVARISTGDVIDDVRILDSTDVLNSVVSCETIFLNGIKVLPLPI